MHKAPACACHACTPDDTSPPLIRASSLHTEGANPNLTNADNQTPLIMAVEYIGPGRPTRDAAVLEAVKLLVAAGADVRHTDTRGGYSLLHCACLCGLPSVVEYVVQPKEQDGCGAQQLMQQPSKEVRACL